MHISNNTIWAVIPISAPRNFKDAGCILIQAKNAQALHKKIRAWSSRAKWLEMGYTVSKATVWDLEFIKGNIIIEDKEDKKKKEESDDD